MKINLFSIKEIHICEVTSILNFNSSFDENIDNNMGSQP